MNNKNDLQLLPGTKKRLGIKIPGENRFLYVGSAILGAAIISAIAFGQYNVSQEKKLESIDGQILEIEQSRERGKEANLVLIKRQFGVVKQLIDSHIYWTKALGLLEESLQTEVVLESMSANANKDEVTMALTADSYTTLARQIAAFLASNGINDVSIGKIENESSGKLKTSFILYFDREKFIQRN